MTRIALTLLSLALLAAPAAAAAIFFDTFEDDAIGLGIDTELVNWTVIAGNLDVVGPGTQWRKLCADSTRTALQVTTLLSRRSLHLTSRPATTPSRLTTATIETTTTG